jgi:4-hydroxybenzoate polyprenyltransferase
MNISTKNQFILRNVQINWIYIIWREALLSWQFIKGDVSSAVIPAVFFMISACRNYALPVNEFTLALGKGLVYFWLYIWAFSLSNQVEGFDEDQLNKPQRPIIQGLVSIRGALIRWVIVSILFLLVGFWFSVWEWALLWLIGIILHNFWGWSKHWVGKNILMSLGVVAQLAAAWQIVGPLTAVAWSWIVVSAAIIFPLISVQDLRDMPGDIANQRKTFPLVIGEYPTRILMSFCFMFLPFLIHVKLIAPAGYNLAVIWCDIILAVVSWLIAARLMLCRSLQADSNTYSLFTYWYCLEMASSILCAVKTPL